MASLSFQRITPHYDNELFKAVWCRHIVSLQEVLTEKIAKWSGRTVIYKLDISLPD